MLILAPWLSIYTNDPEGRRQPARLVAETVKMLRNPMFRGIYSDMKPFKRPGFHPDHIDTTALLVHWQQALFGPRGQLTANLK
ncbi:metal-dependent hydrolase [Mycobacteroides stephanolepidis]|nr:hypothetical protein [[Mycobacterium] stephanolepidis]